MIGKNVHRLTLCAGIVGLALGTALSSWASDARLHDFQAVELGPPGRTAEIQLAIHAFDRSWQLQLADNRVPFAALSKRQRQRLKSEDNRFLSGTVAGKERSWVRMNWVGNRWYGVFFDGDELYLVDRAGSFQLPESRQMPTGQAVVFRLDDLDPSGIIGHAPLEAEHSHKVTSNQESLVVQSDINSRDQTADQFLPVTIVSDVEFNETHNNDPDPVVAGRINIVDGIYASQLGTGIGLFHHEALDDNEELAATGALELLNEFTTFMSEGGGSELPFEGLAHLFTGRERDGSTAGIAWLNVLCSNQYGYGVNWNLSGETISALVVAHELGHNFNAPHDGEEGSACEDEEFEGIMAPTITGEDQFSQCSLDIMSESVADAGCLLESPDEGLIFRDDFFDPT